MSSEINFEIGKIAAQRIRERRKTKGMTIDKLAESTGLSTQTIKLIEAGKRNFRIETLVALSDSLGVSCDYILGKEDKSYEGKIESLISKLTNGEVKYLLSLLEQFKSLLAITEIEKDTNNDFNRDL